MEKFAPYLNKDGLMKRVTVFDDYEHLEPLSLTEHFENRADCLFEMRKDVRSGCATDLFRRGRDDACRGTRLEVAKSMIGI